MSEREILSRMQDYDRYPMHGHSCPWPNDRAKACTCPHVQARSDYQQRFSGRVEETR